MSPFLGGVLLTTPASAFRTAGDHPDIASSDPVRWQSGTIRYQIHKNVPPGFTLDEVQAEVESAFQTWSELQCGGSTGGPRFVFEGITDEAPQSGDGINTVQFVRRGWFAVGHDHDEAALTDAQFVREPEGPWRIVEADLYLNAETMAWTFGASEDPYTRDITSVLVHEAGHIIGMAHPCEEGVVPPDVPSCESDPTFLETTMYPLYDVDQASLSDDDIAGACYLYPSGSVTDDVLVSEQPCQGAGCGASDGDPCEASNQCLSGWCDDAGYCAVSCTTPEDCPEEARCETVANQKSVCVGGGALAGFGEDCADDRECRGHRCVQRDRETPFCTRDCGEGLPACPSGFDCAEVDGHDVCIASMQDLAGGCTVAPRTQPATARGELPGHLFAIMLALGGGMAAFRRSRRVDGGET